MSQQTNDPMTPDARDYLFTTLGELKGMMASMMTQHSDLSKIVSDNTQRISALENYKAWLMGAAVTAGIVASFIFKHL